MTELRDAGPHRLQGRIADWLDRIAPPGRFGRDLLFALAVTLLTVALLAFASYSLAVADGVSLDPSMRWTVLGIACLQSMLLALRRRYLVLCFVTVVALQLLLLAVPDFSIRGPAAFVVAYTLGTRWSGRRAQVAAGLTGLVELLATVAVLRPEPDQMLLVVIGAAVNAVGTYNVPVLLGTAVATRRRYVDLLRERAADAGAAQRASVQAALAAERTRMARELHDVAAHHLSGMVVQAAAVERLVDRDPAAARAGAAWIRSQGRLTLDNLRLTVGVLRETAQEEGAAAPAETAPVPGLSSLAELVETARAFGTPVELVRRGTPQELPPIADIACYRVAQEALSNARQHAPGAAVQVVLHHQPHQVSLQISDDGAGSTAGRGSRTGVGLLGMRERAELIGAEFTVGRVPSGGWQVRLVVPVTALDRVP